jgi:YesN/AraC family two-component response regulator
LYYKDNSELEAEVRVIHFSENFLGEAFTQLPEMGKLRKLFPLAKHGIYFSGNDAENILKYLDLIYINTDQERIMAFINMLNFISDIDKFDFLMKTEYETSFNQIDCDKINKVYEYLLHNYIVGVDFQELSKILNMSLPSLCRYFKIRTHRNITMALNEIRINHACKLLSSEKYSATQICYMVGYSNYSHFNEHFKKITGTTPLKYKYKFQF